MDDNGAVTSSPDRSPAPGYPAPGSAEPDRRSTRWLAALAITLSASWLLSMAPLPWSLLSGVFAAAATVLLVIVVVTAFREGRRGWAVMTTVLALPAVLMLMLGSVTSLIFYGPMSELQDCRARAITERALGECATDAKSSSLDWVSSLLGG